MHRTPANKEQQTNSSWSRNLLVQCVRGDRDVQAIDLGPVELIADPVQVWRQGLGQGTTAIASALNGSSETTTAEKFCLVGGVDYDQSTPDEVSLTPSTDPAAAGPLLLAARGGESMTYGELAGTVAKIETIESILRQYRPTAQPTVLRGTSASETAFARIAPAHLCLHVATHGFFAPETVKNAVTASTTDERRLMGLGQSRGPEVIGQYPELLSGLVFAGVNQPVAEGEDGILTATKVQLLDLRKVDLAILSACETGLGRTAGGEGIIGLQRPSQPAEAKTTITSKKYKSCVRSVPGSIKTIKCLPTAKFSGITNFVTTSVAHFDYERLKRHCCQQLDQLLFHNCFSGWLLSLFAQL